MAVGSDIGLVDSQSQFFFDGPWCVYWITKICMGGCEVKDVTLNKLSSSGFRLLATQIMHCVFQKFPFFNWVNW